MIYPHVVTITHPIKVNDSRGDPKLSYGAGATLTQSSAWVQYRSTTELTADSRRGVVTGWMAFLPAGTPVGAHDRLTWNDKDYEVDGEPNELYNPSGPHHMEVPLKRVEG